MNDLVVEIFADPVCPWCYVGWRALAAAQALRPDVRSARVWRPFLLNPQTPKSGIDRAAYYKAKFSDLQRLSASRAALMRMAAELGAPLDLDAAKILPNTIDAHRLILWAYGQQKGEAFVDAIYRAFWVDGRDIGDAEVLAGISEAAGLDRGAAQTLLSGEDLVDTVLAQHQAAAHGGVTGVPVMIYARKFATQGAISPQEIARAMDAARGP